MLRIFSAGIMIESCACNSVVSAESTMRIYYGGAEIRGLFATLEIDGECFIIENTCE